MRSFLKRQTLSPILILLLFAPLLCHSNEDDNFNQARVLLQEGNTVQAIEVLQEALAATTELHKRADIEGVIGWAYVRLSQYGDARKYLESSLRHAIEAEDEAVELRATNNLGILFYLQNDVENARAFFNQPIARNSDTANTYRILIDIKEKELRSEEAITSGVSKRRNREFEDAIREYDLALQFKPFNPRALEYKGYAQFRLGRYEEAYKTLQISKNMDPHRQFTHLNLLKVSCALDSPDRIQGAIEGSGLDIAVFREWAKVDNELKQVCANSEEYSRRVSGT